MWSVQKGKLRKKLGQEPWFGRDGQGLAGTARDCERRMTSESRVGVWVVLGGGPRRMEAGSRRTQKFPRWQKPGHWGRWLGWPLGA